MRILEFYASFLPKRGGVERHIRDLCKYAQGKNHEAFVLTFLDRGPRYGLVDGIPVYRIRTSTLFYISRFPFIISYGIIVSILAKRLGIDVIHAHDYLPGLAAGIAGKIAGTKVFVTYHLAIQQTTGTPLPGTRHVEKLIRGWVFSSISKVICVSKYTLDMSATAEISPQKMLVIYNWIPMEFLNELDKFPSSKTSLVRTEKDLVMTSIGRLDKQKGFDLLIHILKLLLEKDYRIRLEIVGGGPFRKQLIEHARALGLTKNVSFLGELPEKEKILALLRSDLVVVPSKFEAIPLALLETMYLGKPVVCAKVGGIPEVIVDEYNGILSDNSVKAILGSLEKLMLDKDLRLRVAENAHKTACQRFMPYHGCEQTMNLLSSDKETLQSHE